MTREEQILGQAETISLAEIHLASLKQERDASRKAIDQLNADIFEAEQAINNAWADFTKLITGKARW